MSYRDAIVTGLPKDVLNIDYSDTVDVSSSSIFTALTGDTTDTDATVNDIQPSTSELVVDLGISGTGIPAATTIDSITSANELELSANATATGDDVALTIGYYGDLTTDSKVVTNLDTVEKLEVGQIITAGSGIPDNTLITEIDSDNFTITLSNAATATSSDVFLEAETRSVSTLLSETGLSDGYWANSDWLSDSRLVAYKQISNQELVDKWRATITVGNASDYAIILRKKGDNTFELVDGLYRLPAMLDLGITSIPVGILDYHDID